MSGHSAIGPSSAERWMTCAGSVALSARVPEPPPSQYAVDGTVAHGLAAELVSGTATVEGLMARVGQVVECEGLPVEITMEMIDAVISYRDTLEADYQEMNGAENARRAGIQRHTEVEVRVKSVSEDLWGTADHIMFRPGHFIKVYDFKYGKGHAVEATENKQMGIYMLGALETFELNLDAFDDRELIIVQPRANHMDGAVRRWKASKEWLLGFRNQAHDAVLETTKDGASLVAGDHCRFCKAKPQCPEIYKATIEQTQVDFGALVPTETKELAGRIPGLPQVALMDIKQLALAMGWEDAICDWFASIRAHAKTILQTGGEVPGYKLVDGKAHRKWIDGAKVVAEYGDFLAEDELYEPKKLLSPAKLEKKLGKGKIDHLTFKPDPEKAIAKDTDTRPVARTSAQEDFEAVVDRQVTGESHPSVQSAADDFMSGATGVDAFLGGEAETARIVETEVVPAAAAAEAIPRGKMWPV